MILNTKFGIFHIFHSQRYPFVNYFHLGDGISIYRLLKKLKDHFNLQKYKHLEKQAKTNYLNKYKKKCFDKK